jgi:ABC-type phosphate transport system substrate-binding protein
MSQAIMMRMKAWRLLPLLWVLALASPAQARQLAVITDTGNATTNLTISDLIKIFNAHTRSWPDGKPIKIVLRDPSSADMQLAARKLFNMNGDQARAFVRAHSDLIVVADSDDTVIRFVSSTRGAIGIVDLYSLTKDVNVLKIDGKLPVEQGYLLKGN